MQVVRTIDKDRPLSRMAAQFELDSKHVTVTLWPKNLIEKIIPEKSMFPPGLEPGTFRVLGERDNHYTTETWILELSSN